MSVGELESYAKEEVIALTYNTQAEQMLIKALGRPGIPAIQFTGIQFQKVLSLIRDRVFEWVSNVTEEEGQKYVAAVESAQPVYKPSGLKNFVRENKAWLFEGIGTQIIVGVGALLLALASFLFGSYWSKQQPPSNQVNTNLLPELTPTPSPDPTPAPTIQATEITPTTNKRPMKQTKQK